MPITPNVSITNLGVSASNAHSGQACATTPTNPTFKSTNGYCGTIAWVSAVSDGTVNYHAYYEVYRYNTATSAWDLYDEDHVAVSEADGTRHHAIDFFGPTAAGTSVYVIRAWIYTVTGLGKVGVIKATSANTYVVHKGYAGDPLPKPEPNPGPYPGDDPPIDHPELPPSGPVGPGALQTW